MTQNAASSATGTPVDTLVNQVMDHIRQRIANRSLVAGARIPSIRQSAETMGVSKSTVVDAYDRLVAEGTLVSRRGSGFFVAGQTSPLSIAQLAPKLDRAIDPFWVSRQSLNSDDTVLKPGCGWLPPDWMPNDAIRRALRHVARGPDAALTDYAAPLGSLPLRDHLARRMAEHGITPALDQIMLTESGTQAIDLLCRLLIEPGDTVFVDDPCYFNFHALFHAHRAHIVAIPFLADGPDMDAFEDAAEQHRPRLYVTNSGLHNPTGASLSPVKAHRVLKACEKHKIRIIEDDIFADFETSPAPRLAAFDGLDTVVHIGSFSKTLSASIRCGYIATRPDWIDKLLDLKIATSFGGGNLSSALVLSVLRDGSYRKHMEHVRQRLARTMTDCASKLAELGITPVTPPGAGMFLWARLPHNIDAANLAHAALKQNIILAPGNVFSLTKSAGSLMRFNVTQSLHPRILAFLNHEIT
ncbi:GntR family transcriptional regulator [Thalassospira profundimaris]|uniref:GntR family transcriptional regulator n=1 Tax=Thalassospira profundimaris TaxID=502049 RepID=A0A367X5F1_9PROT|nr:PLP-dependent aminotransferase family protein [Thalassospira profundimaris]RCK48709.1 GntR family transcriptional regulator [Thalassospira profundimaris]